MKPKRKVLRNNVDKKNLELFTSNYIMALTINGTYTYTKPLNTVYVDSEGNLRDPEVPRARGSILLPEVTSAHPDLKDMAGRYNIASNDAITVANGRPVNMHLRKAVEEGAKKQAAWAQEHPYLNMAGLVAGSIPLAIAATPAIVGGGEFAYPLFTNPYADKGIASAFAGHGLNHWINEGIDGWGDAAMTALEIAPLGRLAKPILNEAALAVENYRYPLGRPQVPEGYITVKPQIRTRIGDVEIDNPNLLYHLDRGDSAGAFSNQGAYVKDGRLLPGIAKEGEIPYSWWNLGRPYATSVNGQPMTRLMTTTKDTPGMLHIRSQNYPIGQWNGKRGLVTNAEYVNPEGVSVSESTYTLDPDYGWRRVFTEETPTLSWADATRTPQITAENAASITPEQWTAAQDAAIARGDMAEAQRLRDLHFKIKAPGTDVPDQFHGTHYDDLGNQILLNKGSEQGTNGIGFYTSSSKPYARRYGPNVFGFKVNAKTEDLAQGRFAYLSENRMNELKAQGYKGTIDTTSGPMLGAGKNVTEYTFFNPNIYKLRDAVTYDKNRVRIPLGERDNFNINDIRYGLLPFLGLGAAGALYKN